jgi:sulfite reductase alpha subunit-like flavoprotein
MSLLLTAIICVWFHTLLANAVTLQRAAPLLGKTSHVCKLAATSARHTAASILARTNRCDFLETDPYYDHSNIPMHLFSPKEPCAAQIVSVKRINGPKAPGEVCEVVVNHGGSMPYYEGQSYGVIPPGVNPKTNKPFPNRLYSISSTRYGDNFQVPLITDFLLDVPTL